MANIFNSVQLNKPKSNTFDLSHDVKFSSDMGYLVPVACLEVVPGDVFDISTSGMHRLAPMISPVMHKVNTFTHFFYVPNRLLWDGFEQFITGDKPESPTPTMPYATGVFGVGDLGDYLGVPVGVTIDKINMLPFAAYQCVYNEMYRDQNLIQEIDYKLVDGDNGSRWSTFNTLRKRAWQHDYFTASLPFAQKGDSVNLPLGNFQDVDVVAHQPGAFKAGRFNSNGTQSATLRDVQALGTGGPPSVIQIDGKESYYDPAGTLIAKTSNLNVGVATINDLRVAFRLQEWYERNARGGTRYTESLLSHFGVKSSDARLQRPQYIGGAMNPMVISEVLQQSATDDSTTPQGNMAGHGISVGSGRIGRIFCEDHGYIIGIQSIMPTTAYFQGLPRHFSKFDRFDFAWPTFAHLGEQAVKKGELYYAPDGKNNEDFGYVPRYAEYKYHDSRVAGDFRGNLDFWHMGRKFNARPELNQSFIECSPDKRIFAVEQAGVNSIYSHTFHKIKVKRKLPVYGTPSW